MMFGKDAKKTKNKTIQQGVINFFGKNETGKSKVSRENVTTAMLYCKQNSHTTTGNLNSQLC